MIHMSWPWHKSGSSMRIGKSEVVNGQDICIMEVISLNVLLMEGENASLTGDLHR